jgi:YbbR domain-containing protein
MNFIRGWLFDNLGIKFVALLLAVLIYLNVYTDRPATMVVAFPLQITDLADTLALSGPVPSAIQAELRGTGKELIRLRLREPMVKVSLADVGSGRYERAIGAGDLPLGGPSGPAVERLIGPMLIELSIERRVRHSLPAAAHVEGVPAAGFAWSGEVLLDPARVLVSGPRSAVTKLDSVVLGAASIDGARDTVTLQIAPAALPEWCDSDPATVRVTLPVAPATR